MKRVLPESLIGILEGLAKQDTWCGRDDFNPCDFSGGNYDDAYWGGYDDGQVGLAKKILKELEEPAADFGGLET